MKLTKKDRRRLEGILSYLRSGQNFLLEEKTAVMRNYNSAACDVFVSSYLPFEGEKWSKINKHIGSDLAMLHSGIAELSLLLNESV